jgi:predicted  nucleic acid-binding Zn-ribbon protein
VGEEGGGDDETEGFSASAISQLEKELHVTFSVQLKRELNELATRYRKVVSSLPSKLKDAPSSKDLSKQIQWFEDNAIKPAQTLLKALTVDRHQMRSAMSPDLDTRIDTEHLVPALEKLLDDADAVFVELDQQMAHSITNRDQIQFEIVSALYEAFERNLDEGFTRRGVATIDEALRIACGEVLGRKEQVNSVLKAVRLQASKR